MSLCLSDMDDTLGTLPMFSFLSALHSLIVDFAFSPGRFFAVNELKTMMAHVVLTYDVKLEEDGVIPEATWFKHTLRPNPTARVLFRKRQT